MAADDVVVENNIVNGNEFIGLGIVGLEFISSIRSDPESEPNPDRVAILDNLMWNNGTKAMPEILAALQQALPGTKSVDISDLSSGTGSCILDRHRYPAVGLDRYTTCTKRSTTEILTYTLPEPVAPREIAADEKGKAAFYGICAGCHAYTVQMIGPPTLAIQAIYQGRPQAIADYIANPTRVRNDFPSMPPQGYLAPEVRLAVAEYMLSVEN